MTALIAMDKLLFWLGLGAAQKGAGSKPIERRNWVVSLVVGIVIAVLIGVGAFLLTTIGRDEDVITAGITTTVVLVAAALSPHYAWQQPILRLADTAVGIAVGVGASWITLEVSSCAQHTPGARRRHATRASS